MRRNPRVTTKNSLSNIRRWSIDMIRVWTVRSTIRDLPDGASRPREFEEYPENSMRRWAELALYAKALRDEAAMLLEFAEEQQGKARERILERRRGEGA